MAAVLSSVGLQNESFADTGEFLASVAAGAAYDLCIVDIHLPGMRGDDLLVELGRNRRARDTVILFLSGLETEELERARRRLSAFFTVVDYTCKPVDAGSLLERVQGLIARKPRP